MVSISYGHCRGLSNDQEMCSAMNRPLILLAVLIVFELSGATSYVVLEWIAALVLIAFVFVAVLLIALVAVLTQRTAMRCAAWLQIRLPQWNLAGRAWAYGSAHLLKGRPEWWVHRFRAPAALSSDTD